MMKLLFDDEKSLLKTIVVGKPTYYKNGGQGLPGFCMATICGYMYFLL